MRGREIFVGLSMKIIYEYQLLDKERHKEFIQYIQIHFSRLNSRFKDSYEFALLLLKKSIPLFGKDKKSFAFLFDMNVVFEKFIGNIYKSIDSSTKTQYQKSFGNLLLKPDIYMDNLIIDTKYKRVKDINDLKRDDKYQMFVYGTNFGITNTMLLYPKYIYDVDIDLELGENDTIVRVKMKSIDLDFGGGYDEYICKIKKRIKRI